MTIAFLLAGLVAVNLLTMLRFWQDKRRAAAGRRRIPEAHLLGLAVVGGSPGALLARRILLHKTRKQPFSARLHLIAAGQVGVLAAFLYLDRS